MLITHDGWSDTLPLLFSDIFLEKSELPTLCFSHLFHPRQYFLVHLWELPLCRDLIQSRSPSRVFNKIGDILNFQLWARVLKFCLGAIHLAPIQRHKTDFLIWIAIIIEYLRHYRMRQRRKISSLLARIELDFCERRNCEIGRHGSFLMLMKSPDFEQNKLKLLHGFTLWYRTGAILRSG